MQMSGQQSEGCLQEHGKVTESDDNKYNTLQTATNLDACFFKEAIFCVGVCLDICFAFLFGAIVQITGIHLAWKRCDFMLEQVSERVHYLMQLVEYMEALNRSSGEKSFSGTSYPDVEVPKLFDIVKSEPVSVDQSKNFFDQGLEALSQWTLEKLEPSHSNSFSSPKPNSQQVAQLDFTKKTAHHQQGTRSEQQVSRSESSLPIVEGKGFVDSTWVSPDHCVLQ